MVESADDLVTSITYGPLSRFGTVPPDIAVDPECDEWSPPQVDALPDVDGDGVRELRVVDATWDCPSWTLPLRTGRIVPEQEPGAGSGAPLYDVIADQTGDTLPDVWTRADRQVLAAPVSFSAGLTSAGVVMAPTELVSVKPLGADVTGDGLADFLVNDDDRGDIFEEQWVDGVGPSYDSWMYVLPGGPSLQTGADTGTVFDLGGGGGGLRGRLAAVEDGVVCTLAVTSGTAGPPAFVVVDLGAGSLAAP